MVENRYTEMKESQIRRETLAPQDQAEYDIYPEDDEGPAGIVSGVLGGVLNAADNIVRRVSGLVTGGSPTEGPETEGGPSVPAHADPRKHQL